MNALRQLLLFALVCAAVYSESSANETSASERPVRSHPRMRKPIELSHRGMSTGPMYFVDGVAGDDANSGAKDEPWKTLRFALRQLQPGDSLVLREGVYFEHIAPTISGVENKPVTIRAYPGERVIIDGGRREFFEQPQTAWKPATNGAVGEFVSTRSYSDADARRAPFHFLPAAWEPMFGIENERPLALGHFVDSMVPLHGYRTLHDLRSSNELWIGSKKEMQTFGLYCGPGLWFNRKTGRIHCRLAHHELDALGEHVYRGETDPRKIPLSVGVGFGEEVLRITGIKHLRIQDLEFRGATGSPMIHIYGSQNVELDGLSVFGGAPGLLVNASQDILVTNSAFRGLAAPWSSRAHMKYSGTPSYQIVLRDDQPRNQNIEFSYCEFTDDHDFAFLRFAKDLRFHHNYVDNFNDDGLECGPKLRDHSIYIYQNFIGRCLIPLTSHEIEKDESPLDHDPVSGVFVYRNVFDMRGGTFRGPPTEKGSSTSIFAEGHLVGDHGSPVWPVMKVYHNTFIRDSPVFRNYFLFGLGAQGLRQNERDVFNNIFVQTDRNPGTTIPGKKPSQLREGGNVIWGAIEGPHFEGDIFARFRSSKLFEASRQVYKPGWTTDDKLADPHFVDGVGDLRLKPASPAIDFGLPIPDSWPDSMKVVDKNKPDSGAFPLGSAGWKIGVRQRKRIAH